MDFRVEMFRMFKKHKEIIRCTGNKTKEKMIAEMKNIQTEMSQLKNLLNTIINLLEDLSGRITAVEDRIDELKMKCRKPIENN